jgi:hypothetical protein
MYHGAGRLRFRRFYGLREEHCVLAAVDKVEDMHSPIPNSYE